MTSQDGRGGNGSGGARPPATGVLGRLFGAAPVTYTFDQETIFLARLIADALELPDDSAVVRLAVLRLAEEVLPVVQARRPASETIDYLLQRADEHWNQRTHHTPAVRPAQPAVERTEQVTLVAAPVGHEPDAEYRTAARMPRVSRAPRSAKPRSEKKQLFCTNCGDPIQKGRWCMEKPECRQIARTTISRESRMRAKLRAQANGTTETQNTESTQAEQPEGGVEHGTHGDDGHDESGGSRGPG